MGIQISRGTTMTLLLEFRNTRGRENELESPSRAEVGATAKLEEVGKGAAETARLIQSASGKLPIGPKRPPKG